MGRDAASSVPSLFPSKDVWQETSPRLGGGWNSFPPVLFAAGRAVAYQRNGNQPQKVGRFIDTPQ